MKLYGVVGSNNARKVLAVVNHLGLTLEVEYLDFFAGDLRAPDYLALNPNGMVPVLVDGDFTLNESNAINIYLAETTPGHQLYGSDARSRAQINRWISWELAHYNKAFGVLAFEAVAKQQFLGLEPDPALVRWAGENLARFAAVLEGHMTGREFAVGDQLTLADYALIHVEMFKEMVPFDWSPYPQVNSYYERMRAVPHWAATAPPSMEAIGRRPEAA